MRKNQLLWFILVPGLAGGLGWAIRGQLGHGTGAMIPGVFVALALCLLLEPENFRCGLVVGLGALGFAFGAQMTTLQTAGFINGTNPHAATNMVLGYTGLAMKGALWALFEGAALGLAFTASRYHRKDVGLAAVFMLVGFYVGWVLINRPKLLYFSVDRPEVWCGLLLGGIVLLVWLTVRGHTYTPLVLAVCAAVAGGIGYPVAVTLCAAGVHSSPVYFSVTSYMGRWVDWWKVAEITFGSFMGAGLGIGTYLLKDNFAMRSELKESGARPRSGMWGITIGVALGALCMALWEWRVPWVILGLLLMCAAFYSTKLAWHIGVTATFFGTAANAVLYWHREQGLGNAVILWVLALLATLAVSWKVTTWWAETDAAVARKAFIFVMWAILTLSYLKTFINHAVLNPTAQGIAAAGGRWRYTVEVWGSGLTVEALFTIAAIVLTWMAYRSSRLQAAPEGKTSLRPSEALT